MGSEHSVPHGHRVLMLTNDRQIDRRILLEADSLEELGWNVTILAMPLDGIVDSEDRRVVRIGQHAPVGRREHRLLALYAWIRRRLPMNGWLMRSLKAFAWRFLVDQERFYIDLFLPDGRQMEADIVVAHDLPMLAVARQLASEFQARLVYDSHELYCEQEFSRGLKRRWAAIERRHITACDRVITVNASIATELERRYGVSGVEVIHNADRIGPLEQRSWYLHEHFDIPRDCKILLFQGGLSAGRNLPQLVEAMALLRGLPIHLVVLGDGQLAESLARMIRRLGLAEGVHLHPAVKQSELLAITVSADAGVIPYQATCLNNYYCTPNKLFEFIAAGLPILGSDLPELRRLIMGNGVGQVFDLSSAEKIATAVSGFFADEQRLLSWRDTVKRVREEICWQQEGRLLQEIYKALA